MTIPISGARHGGVPPAPAQGGGAPHPQLAAGGPQALPRDPLHAGHAHGQPPERRRRRRPAGRGRISAAAVTWGQPRETVARQISGTTTVPCTYMYSQLTETFFTFLKGLCYDIIID